MKTIVDRIRDLVGNFTAQGFYGEADQVSTWLDLTSEVTIDNINKHMNWRDVYTSLHVDLDFIGEALFDLGANANLKACEQQPSIDGGLLPLPKTTPNCETDDAVLAQMVVDRLVESEVFYVLLGNALKGRLNAY